MSQLRLVWNSHDSNLSLLDTKPKPAKCCRSRTPSMRSQQLLKKLDRLMKERPIAFAVLEKRVDKAIALLDQKIVIGALLE